MTIQEGDWNGQTAVCICSGPSLTKEDVELVRASGRKVVAVNNAWEMARFCDVIYAADRAWWYRYHDKIDSPAERWTRDGEAARAYELNKLPSVVVENSGLRAVDLARHFGAERILLLGYDCQLTGGKTHWHGDHINGLANPNRQRCRNWNIQFTRFAKVHKKLTVINCSRVTALTAFPRMALEEALRA